jgi:hypothetical protein
MIDSAALALLVLSLLTTVADQTIELPYLLTHEPTSFSQIIDGRFGYIRYSVVAIFQTKDLYMVRG